jgi:hypothetical protein
MARTILIMAAGTGGHIFGSDPLEGDALALNVAGGATLVFTQNATPLRGEAA